MTSIAAELRALDRPWDPFSTETEIWHSCPGHEWERFDFDLSRGRCAARLQTITRCGRCGAPRCDAYTRLSPTVLMRIVMIVGRTRDVLAPTDEDDAVAQFRRCTLERHHVDEHDFLVEVGA